MGRDDIIDEIERRIEEPTTVSADDLDVGQQCTYCETPMPYEDYNEHSPQLDYICRILPTRDEEAPPRKDLYCTATCLIKDVRETEKELYG